MIYIEQRLAEIERRLEAYRQEIEHGFTRLNVKIDQQAERAVKAEQGRDDLKARIESGPRTFEAKWLDPECRDGCQSLVLKVQCQVMREALEFYAHHLSSESFDGDQAVRDDKGQRALQALGKETK